MTHVNFTTSGVALTDNQIARIREIIEYTKRRSAWDKGVKLYALELLDNYCEMVDYAKETGVCAPRFIESVLLNGADDWLAYSEGGLSLVYDKDIAERLCSPSELKRKTSRNGGSEAEPRRNMAPGTGARTRPGLATASAYGTDSIQGISPDYSRNNNYIKLKINYL